MTTLVRKAAEKAADRSSDVSDSNIITTADGNYDITNLLTNDSYMMVRVDGKFVNVATLGDHTVEQGAAVQVYLEWDTIPKIQKGQKLVYQIPTNMVTNIVELSDILYDGNGLRIGTFTIEESGLITVDITDSYFNNLTAQQHSDTLELDYLKINFSGTLNSNRGETSGNGDNVIRFKDQTDGVPESAVEFEVPFVYPNETGIVNVSKGSTFDAATRTIHYTVKVSTPSANLITSKNVKLTDAYTAAQNYLSKTYQNVKATLYTSTSDGTNLTGGTDVTSKFNASTATMDIGDMERDSVVVVEYDATVKDSYFSDVSVQPITNTATVNFNDTGVNTATTQQSCSGAVTMTKSAGTVTQDTAGYYIPYTVTVRATGEMVTDVKVVDDLSTGNGDKLVSELKGFAVDGDGVSTDVCSYDSSTQIMTWNIGTMTGGEVKTLTYKGYLNMEALDDGPKTASGKAVITSKTVTNDAKLYVGNTLYSEAKVPTTIEKQWLYKTGKKDDSGTVSYTLRVNGFPSAENVTTIFDKLPGDSKDATIDLPLTVKVYTKTASSTSLVDTYTVNSDNAGLTYGSDGKSWELNLKNAGIETGTYYYEVTYTVSNTGGLVSVNNNAGVGLNNGKTYSESTSVEVKTVTSSKALTDLDYGEGIASWKSTMETDIDAGTVYWDWYDDDNVKNGAWWFTAEQIAAVKVYLGDELIYSAADGINPYQLTVTPGIATYNGSRHFTANGTFDVPHYTYGTDRTQSPTKTTSKEYNSFQITFGKDVDVASAKKVLTIEYTSSISEENLYYLYRTNFVKSHDSFKGYRYAGTYPTNFKNSWRWTLASGVDSGERYTSSIYFYGNEDVIKGASYDKETGIITWKVFLNRQGDMNGEATVVDTIPDNLTYLPETLTLTYGDTEIPTYIKDYEQYGDSQWGSVEITYSKGSGNGEIDSSSYDESTRQLTVNLKNLLGYSFRSGSSFDASLAMNGGWWDDGTVTLTYETRVDDLTLLTDADGKVTFNNVVTVTSDTMAFGSSTAKYTEEIEIASTSENLVKTMNTYNGGYTLTFNMAINPNSTDLITGEDTIKVLDVMGSKLSMKMDTVKVTETDTGSEVDFTVTQVETSDGTHTYEFTVPDSKKLTITYKALMDGALGEPMNISNTAYFEYEGKAVEASGATASDSFSIYAGGAEGGASGTPCVHVYKYDQWDNPVAGAVFEVYEVMLSDDGEAQYNEKGEVVLSDDPVKTGTTGADGIIQFEGLDVSKVYCLVEASAPVGYKRNTTPQYFYYTYRANLGIEGALGISMHDKTYEVENTYVPASLTVPVQKTINGETVSSAEQFTFTLDNFEGTVYSDEACTTEVKTLETTVAGSGTVNFDTLYFKAAGTYKFSLTENTLTAEQTGEGFTGDTRNYTVTVEVVQHTDGSLYVKSANADDANGHTFDLTKGEAPLFNNTLKLEDATLTLTAYKKLTGDVDQRDAIKAGEFTFTVYDDNGQKIATGQTKAAGSDGVSEIEFTDITFTQAQMGTQYLRIVEDTGTDDSILYSKQSMTVQVKVDAGKGGKVTATVEKYYTQNSEYNGYPLFTNQYTYTEPDIVVSGVHVDFVPYVLVAAAVVVVGAGAGVVRWRRRKNED
jgi:hypothetical protein